MSAACAALDHLISFLLAAFCMQQAAFPATSVDGRLTKYVAFLGFLLPKPCHCHTSLPELID
jgi:hypothetical protein